MFKVGYTATLEQRDLADTMAVSKKLISLRGVVKPEQTSRERKRLSFIHHA